MKANHLPSGLTVVPKESSAKWVTNGVITESDAQVLKQFHDLEMDEAFGERFRMSIPDSVRENYYIATVRNNDSSTVMVRDLVENFMRVYSNPEGTDVALQALDILAVLADETK